MPRTTSLQQRLALLLVAVSAVSALTAGAVLQFAHDHEVQARHAAAHGRLAQDLAGQLAVRADSGAVLDQIGRAAGLHHICLFAADGSLHSGWPAPISTACVDIGFDMANGTPLPDGCTAVRHVTADGRAIILAMPAAFGADGLLTILGGLALSLLLAMALAAWPAMRLAQRITQPLGDLRDAVVATAAGASGRRAPESGTQETRELARAFNTLSADLAAGERASAASEQLLRNIINSVPYIIFARDERGRMMFANPALAQRYAVDVETLVARAQDPDDPTVADDPLLGGEEMITAADGTLWHTDALGASRRLQVNRIPFPLPDGSAGELVVAFDVTDERHLEEQLRHAQKLETIGTLAGGIAHDFNNLLTPIMGYTALMLDADLDTATRERLEAIAKAARRGRDLVQQILTFSRQSDSMTLDVVTLPDLCSDAMQLLQATIPKTIEISADVAEDTWPVLGDAGQLQQVLINLGTNAAQACAGQGHVSISTANLDQPPDGVTELPPGPCVRLRVRDDGEGMSAHIAERIFEPFFTTKDVGAGTGLGLSVVHGIVSGHGGTIQVDSAPGDGTTIDILLPATPGAEAADSDLASEPDSRPARVLLVDDEDAVRDVVRLMLEHMGHSVDAHADPLTALQAFRDHAHAYDVVVTDNSMPHMDGHGLASALREVRDDMPIVLCSGLIDAASDVSGVIDRFVMKPVSRRQLAEAIAGVLATS